MLVKNGGDRERISSVKSYSSYQLLFTQGYCKGWVLLGDALGFANPMLSPSVHMSIESAALLEKHVLRKVAPTENDFKHYCTGFKSWYDAWN